MQMILKVYLRLFIMFFPLLVWPVSVDSYGAGKVWILVIGAALGIILWGLTVIIDKVEVVRVNKFLTIWLMVVLWGAVSWFRGAIGVRARSVDLMFGLSSLMALWSWLWLFLQVGDKEERRIQFNYLSVSGIILSIFGLVTFLMPSKSLPLVLPSRDLPLLSITQGWSLAGGLWAQIIVLSVLFLWWTKSLMEKIKKGQGTILPAIMLAMTVLGLFLSGYFLTKTGRNWLDVNTSWVIAVETFKRSPLWGVGLGNFVQAFLSFRPATFNLTPQWGMIFGYSGVGLLQWWTELGIVGFGLVAWLLMVLIRRWKSDWLVLITALAVLGLPFQLTGLFLLIWLLAGVGERTEQKLILRVGESGFNVMPMVVAVLMVVVLGGMTFYTAKSAVAGFYVWKSYLTALKNDGVGTYNWRLKAVGVTQNVAEMRVLYSQTNLALAKALLSNKDLSEEDKQKVSVLLQQAVSEAKAAVSLDSNNSTYWTNLATIYRDMIGIIDGAADWTLQAYQQAAIFDSVNVMLKLDMGGLLYGAGRYEEADRLFEQAVVNKQDLANAWYNWAYSGKKLNKLAEAVQRLQQAVALVPTTSGDYESASKELTDWKKEYDEAVAKQQELLKQQQAQQQKQPETLKAPQALPTVSKEEKVNVPAENLEPPKVSTTPMPSPTETVKE